MSKPKDTAAPHAPRKATQGQGIVRDERGQEQPQDKDRAQKVSQQNSGENVSEAAASGKERETRND
jgi:hypothetical protein